RGGEYARNVFHVLRLLVVGDGEDQRMPAGGDPRERHSHPSRAIRNRHEVFVDVSLQRLRIDAGAAVAYCQLEKATAHPEDPRGRRSRVTEPEAESESTRPAACRRVEDDVVGPGAGESDAGDETVAAVARPVGILVVREGRVAGEPVLVPRPDHPRLDFDAW